ncbi:MAG: response regulator receiver [Puniceicoccaceae bacterium 5H]|nr:MAG: response regulator receiver [Puniceicoccaceae bacterium 5H]
MNPPHVLVVDDQPINVRLLERKLERVGMRVTSAFSGIEALEYVQREQPDVILLDIMMPMMDGIEVCRRLKEDAHTRDIPVIFITAKTSKEGKLEGLNVGAADYITKPIDLDETVARISTQLRIQENYRQNLELTNRLGEARRHAAIAHVTEGIAHNLNNLLGVVVGYLDLLRASLDNRERMLRTSDKLDQAVKRMVNIVRELTTIAEFDRVRKTPVPVTAVIGNALQRFRAEYSVPQAQVVIDNQVPELELETNQEMLEDIIGRLLINGYESYEDDTPASDRALRLTATQESGEFNEFLRITISDHGQGVDSEMADTAFEPFVSRHSAVGRGMGLTIVRHAIHSLGGTVKLEKHTDGSDGTVAVIQHPFRDPADEEIDWSQMVGEHLPEESGS